jgi:hypothetical protein
MAASPPVGIGDSTRAEFVLSREEHPLPGTRKEIVARIETLLSLGGVQKLVVELGRPIRLDRMVDRNNLANPPADAPPDDLLNQIRNGDLTEMVTEKSWTPYQVLFHAFSKVSARRMKPAAIYCRDFGAMRKWLGLPPAFDLSQVCGVDGILSKDMPDDAFILAAVSYDETNVDSVLGIRVPMDFPKEKKS